MKTKSAVRAAFVSVAALLFCFPSRADAQLFVNVDPVQQTYFLSGSATGNPFTFPGPFAMSEIFWDNGQPLNGGFEDFLSSDAFIIAGNTSPIFTMFIHGNGDINGALELDAPDITTLTGDSSTIFDYSGWAAGVIIELEDKATAGEVLPVTMGSSNFDITFRGVPEPSSLCLLLLGTAPFAATLFYARRRLRCSGDR